MKVLKTTKTTTTPTSPQWNKENSKKTFHPPKEECYIFNCKSKMDKNRNFTCLKGDWNIKVNWPHAKVCIYHYNCDLKNNPRNIKVSKRRKRKRNKKRDITYFPSDYDDIIQSKRRKINKVYKNFKETQQQQQEEICCLVNCKEKASIRNKKSLKVDKRRVKICFENTSFQKICNKCYLRDLKMRKYPDIIDDSINEKIYILLNIEALVKASYIVDGIT